PPWPIGEYLLAVVRVSEQDLTPAGVKHFLRQFTDEPALSNACLANHEHHATPLSCLRQDLPEPPHLLTASDERNVDGDRERCAGRTGSSGGVDDADAVGNVSGDGMRPEQIAV